MFIVRKLTVFYLAIIIAAGAFADVKNSITGTVEWDTMRISAAASIDLVSAGIRLPAGRNQGETFLTEGYLKLIRPVILDLQVDSSSTIADLVNRGEFSLPEVDVLALRAVSIPPALSPDMLNMTSSYSIPLSGVSSSLLRHKNPSQPFRTLNPVSAASYTGIIIIASDSLPVHGMRSTTTAIPCLFPKIWDSSMNLVYERNMLESRNGTMVSYSPPQGIFQNNPSGLSRELQEIVGERPLRIFARGVFGIKPTDLIIDASDAMLIISSEENRRLLSQGKVAIILDESVLRHKFAQE